MEPWPFKGLFDAIFCRNVMIYFDNPTKTSLIERFTQQLKPGGWLYIGHSESLIGAHPGLQAGGPHHLSEGSVSARGSVAACDRRRAASSGAISSRRRPSILRRGECSLDREDVSRRISTSRPRRGRDAGHGTGLVRLGLHSRSRRRHRRNEPFHAGAKASAADWGGDQISNRPASAISPWRSSSTN